MFRREEEKMSNTDFMLEMKQKTYNEKRDELLSSLFLSIRKNICLSPRFLADNLYRKSQSPQSGH